MNEQPALPFPLLSWPGKPDRKELDALRDSAGIPLESYFLDAYGPLAAQWLDALYTASGASCAPSGASCAPSCLSRAPASLPLFPGLLVQGDNLNLLTLLQRGPLQEALALRGGIKLAYIDPPFAVGSDFLMPVAAGDAPALKALAYSDVWKNGLCGYLSMIYTRLALIKDALAQNGCIVVHCDWRTAPHLRLVLDELFGPERFLGDIVWHYTGGGRARRWFSRKHDRLLHYAVSDSWTFHADAVRVPYKTGSGYAKSGITSRSGKKYLPNPKGTPVDDVWDIPMINPLAAERCGYPTQKPAALMERIVQALSSPGDIVADFFCGSGSFPLAAAKLGRTFIACDSSPLAMLASQERLASLAAEEKGGQYIFARAPKPAAQPATRPKFRPAARFSASLSGSEFFYRLLTADLDIDTDATSIRISLKHLSFIPQGGAVPEAPALFAADWQQWLAAWNVGLALPPQSAASSILWDCHKRKGSGVPLKSPRLALDKYSGYIAGVTAFVVTLTDIFGNRTRIRLAPAPDGSFIQEPQPEII